MNRKKMILAGMLLMAATSFAQAKYISQMKKELFGSAGKCSGMCYYMNVLSFCKNNRSGEHIKRRK